MHESILARVAAGDSVAVQECIARYGGLVYSIAARYLGNRADAEDAVQEIFLDVWKSAASHDPSRGSEVVFIAMIARRRLIDRRRKQAVRVSAASLESDVEGIETLDWVEMRDEFERARMFMKECKTDERRCIELCVMQGCTHEEASTQLGIPLGTLKSHVRRGLNRLRAMLRGAGAVAAGKEAAT